MELMFLRPNLLAGADNGEHACFGWVGIWEDTSLACSIQPR